MGIFDKLRRVQDAIFCLSEVGVRPDIQEELKKDEKALNDAWKIEQKEIESLRVKRKENIPDDLRWAVFERDNFTCRHCGNRRNLTVDHVFPESKGGKATMENCQTLCKTCNSRKGAR